MILTANHGGGLKRPSNSRVQLYHQVILGGDSVVALADLLLDPLVKLVTYDRVDHVGNPGPR